MTAPQIPLGTFSSTLVCLLEKGVRYSTVIDVGCADGHFFLSHKMANIFQDAAPFHVDANPIYETSLKSIKEVAGGDYFIGATTDHDGEVEMTSAAHPYWNSLVPQDSAYWKKINGLSGGKTKVPAAKLDTLIERFNLKPPYLLKMDVQGGELATLRGAPKVLENTLAVICETDMDDFDAVHAALAAAGFFLFDITQLSRLGDRSLGWFYPVYVSRTLASLKQNTFWTPSENDSVINAQVERRKAILQQMQAMLAQLRSQRR